MPVDSGRGAVVRLVVTLAITLSLLMIGSATPAAADCGDEPGMPSRIRDTIGSTWIGTFESSEALDSASDAHTWDVEQSLRGAVPKNLRYATVGCQRVRFLEGERYLVSTGNIASPTGFDTIAYRLLGHDKVRLVGFGFPASMYLHRWHAGTITAALDVMGLAELPDTGTPAAPNPPPAEVASAAAVVFGAIAAIIAYLRLDLSRVSASDGEGD